MGEMRLFALFVEIVVCGNCVQIVRSYFKLDDKCVSRFARKIQRRLRAKRMLLTKACSPTETCYLCHGFSAGLGNALPGNTGIIRPWMRNIMILSTRFKE